MLKNKLESGVSLYLSIMVTAVLLAVALGISTIFITQAKTAREMGYSVIAFYAADAGIEAVLMNRANPANIPQTSLSNEATYRVIVTSGGAGGCAAVNYCIKSLGSYKEINR